MRKIVVEITVLDEREEKILNRRGIIQHIIDDDIYQSASYQFDVLSDTADPQVGRKAESGVSPAQPAGRLIPDAEEAGE